MLHIYSNHKVEEMMVVVVVEQDMEVVLRVVVDKGIHIWSNSDMLGVE